VGAFFERLHAKIQARDPPRRVGPRARLPCFASPVPGSLRLRPTRRRVLDRVRRARGRRM